MNKTKKNKIFLCVLAVAIVLVGVIIILGIQHQQKYFLKNLKISQIESISVYSLSSMELAVLSGREVSDVVNQLNKIKLTGGSKLFRRYNGTRTQMFYIKLTNNKAFEFSASNPFYIIDIKTGYEADYSICEGLSQTYYSLLEKYFPRN